MKTDPCTICTKTNCVDPGQCEKYQDYLDETRPIPSGKLTKEQLMATATFAWINIHDNDDIGLVLTTKDEMPRIRNAIRNFEPESFPDLITALNEKNIVFYVVPPGEDRATSDIFQFDSERENPWKIEE